MTKEYIGDGVYVSFDGWQLELSTDRMGNIEKIYLDDSTYGALLRYVAKIKRRAKMTRSQFIEWISELEVQTLTDELKQDICEAIEKLED